LKKDGGDKEGRRKIIEREREEDVGEKRVRTR
jgi:hypothetical protein